MVELRGALQRLRVEVRAAPACAVETLQEAGVYMDEAEDDWRRVWAWLHCRASLQQLHPGYPLLQVRGSCGGADVHIVAQHVTHTQR